MLRSSKEGRKQAARYHAFPPPNHTVFSSRSSHHSFSSHQSSKKISSLSLSSSSSSSSLSSPIPLPLSSPSSSPSSSSSSPSAAAASPSSKLNRSRTTGLPPLHSNMRNAKIKSSSLRQTTIDESDDSKSVPRSSPLTAIDDIDDSTNGVSRLSTERVTPMEKDIITPVLEDSAEQTKERAEEDTILPCLHSHIAPSRGTTEEQSQSVSQGGSSALSSPPTSHPDEDDDGTAENLKNWQDRLKTPEYINVNDTEEEESSEQEEAVWNHSPPRPSLARYKQCPIHIDLTDEKDDSVSPDHHRQRKRDPRSVEGGDSMVDNRGQRVKVKSLKMKEAEETNALSPNSRKKAQVEQTITASSSQQNSVRDEERLQQDFHTLESRTAIKRKRGRPLGSTKQKSSERRASQTSEMREASLDSTNADREAALEFESSTDSLQKRRSARGKPEVQDALNYLSKVQRQFKESPDIYNQFLDIMNEFRDNKTNIHDVIEQVLTLLRECPSLMEGFNAFLPSVFRIKCSIDPITGTTITVTTPTGTTTRNHPPEKPTKRGKRQSNVAKANSSAKEDLEKARQPVRARASLPNPHKSEESKEGKIDAKNVDSKKLDVEEKMCSASTSHDSSIAQGEGSETAAAKAVKVAWKRKSYLTSGLYSDDYKKDETVKSIARRSSTKVIPESLARGTPRTRKAHQVSALPLPVDYGLNLLEQQRDFRLPYSIAQEIQDIRNKMEAKKKPPPYKHIAQNQYFSRPKLEGELMICQCPANSDCGDSCVNRLTECLCHPKHCPCKERCTNIYFGKRKVVKTEVQWYGARGFGLKTLEPIKKGGFIDEYRGEVIDFNEAVRRIRDHYKDTGNYYFLMYDAPAGEMLDGGLKGNITRFANHSCDPNCKVQKWIISGSGEIASDEYQVALFAERDIEAGEELTYDYGWSAFAAKAVSGESNSTTPEVCHCGAAKCSGFLGVKKSAVPVASEVVSKVSKRSYKKKVKSTSGLVAESSKHNAQGKASIPAPLSISTSTSVPVLESSTKISFDSATKASSTSPANLTSSKLNRKGLMGQVWDGLASPGSTLTSLSSMSDEDVSELEKSVDSNMGSYDSQPMRRFVKTSTYKPLQQAEEDLGQTSSLGKRKRVSARHSSPVEIYRRSTNVALTSSNNQKDIASTSKPGRILLKDRIIRVLVPRDEEEEETKANLIIEGKRERKMSLKAAEFNSIPSEKYYNKRRATSTSSSNDVIEVERGFSVDRQALPAAIVKKVIRGTEIQSSPISNAHSKSDTGVKVGRLSLHHRTFDIGKKHF